MRILVTGGAGFIGSNLVGSLLEDNRVSFVRVLDSLDTGTMENMADYLSHPGFEFIKGDIRDIEICMKAAESMDMIDHQAALGSVARSIADPHTTNEVNISGTLNVFNAAREMNIKRLVYASSSAIYGDHRSLPKVEDIIGKPLSPYAVTKYVNELYAQVFPGLYKQEYIGLRYFNVFGPRQDPKGPYAAVIPLFIKALIENKPPLVHGDGRQSRDFTFVDNVVQANIKALFIKETKAVNQVYNIACGQQTSLLQLFEALKSEARSSLEPVYGPPRSGDVRHSLADITKARTLLNYEPLVSVQKGLKDTFDWYSKNLGHL